MIPKPAMIVNQAFLFASLSVAIVAILMALRETGGEDVALPRQWSDWTLPPRTDEREFLYFPGGDGITQLAGKLFLPLSQNETDTLPPVVVLAHGLGLSQDCSLDAFVQAFTEEGFAAFTFDYATFGASEGFPRHQVKPNNHVKDLEAAVAMLRNTTTELPIDRSRIALWGTSLGGGHVLTVAARDPSIRAVVAQVPALSSAMESVVGTLLRSPGPTSLALLKTLGSLLLWSLRSLLQPQVATYVPLHGVPGSSGMMQNPGDHQGYGSLIPREGGAFGWKNAATAGSVLPLLIYRPLNSVSKIQVPTLLAAAEQDTLCPAASVEQARQRIASSGTPTEMVLLNDAMHFDIYSGAELKTLLKATVSFYQKYL